MRLWSWVADVSAIPALVERLLPPTGFVAVWAPDGAMLVGLEEPGFRPSDAGRRWPQGRAFGLPWETLWRCEAERGWVVAAGDVPEHLQDGGEPCPALDQDAWQPLGWQRPSRYLLFDRGDQRLPRDPVYPARFTGARALEIVVQEFGDGDGLTWVRYLDVQPMSGG